MPSKTYLFAYPMHKYQEHHQRILESQKAFLKTRQESVNTAFSARQENSHQLSKALG